MPLESDASLTTTLFPLCASFKAYYRLSHVPGRGQHPARGGHWRRAPGTNPRKCPREVTVSMSLLVSPCLFCDPLLCLSVSLVLSISPVSVSLFCVSISLSLCVVVSFSIEMKMRRYWSVLRRVLGRGKQSEGHEETASCKSPTEKRRLTPEAETRLMDVPAHLQKRELRRDN